MSFNWSLFRLSGLEDFENKIDKIAAGSEAPDDENSWISRLYNKFVDNGATEDTGNNANVEGLEPPMLDETWGLHDDPDPPESGSDNVNDNEQPRGRSKRTTTTGEQDEDLRQFAKDFEGVKLGFISTTIQDLIQLQF